MRRLVLSVAVLLVAAACGGGGGADEDTLPGGTVEEAAGPDPSELIDPVEVAEAIVAELGDEAGFAAVVLAFDAGYSLTQVIEAGLAGTLEASGTIRGELPTGPPYGLIEAPTAAGALFQRQDHVPTAVLALAGDVTFQYAQSGEQVPLDELLNAAQKKQGTREEAEEEAEQLGVDGLAAIKILLRLVDLGYSLEQVIVDGFLAGGFEEGVARYNDLDITGTSFQNLHFAW